MFGQLVTCVSGWSSSSVGGLGRLSVSRSWLAELIRVGEMDDQFERN